MASSRSAGARAPSPSGAARPRSYTQPARSTDDPHVRGGAPEERPGDHERARSTPGRSSRSAFRSPTARRTWPSISPRAWSSRARTRVADRRQGLQDRPDPDEDGHRARPQGRAARPSTAGTPPTSSATATARCSTTRTASRPRRVSKLSVLETILQPEAHHGALRQLRSQGPHRLLPAARRREGGVGQHRPLRVARLPDADEDQLPLPGLDPRGADRPRPRALARPRAARRASTGRRSGSRSTSRAPCTRRSCTRSTICSSS